MIIKVRNSFINLGLYHGWFILNSRYSDCVEVVIHLLDGHGDTIKQVDLYRMKGRPLEEYVAHVYDEIVMAIWKSAVQGGSLDTWGLGKQIEEQMFNEDNDDDTPNNDSSMSNNTDTK